jgi:hypothetical protein
VLRLFDGETFSAGAAAVLIEENRIVAVESGFLHWASNGRSSAMTTQPSCPDS